jgi:hypothetical protein
MWINTQKEQGKSEQRHRARWARLSIPHLKQNQAKSNEIKPIQMKSNFLANCGHPCYHAHIANASSYISRRTCPRRRTHHTRRSEID